MNSSRNFIVAEPETACRSRFRLMTILFRPRAREAAHDDSVGCLLEFEYGARIAIGVAREPQATLSAPRTRDRAVELDARRAHRCPSRNGVTRSPIMRENRSLDDGLRRGGSFAARLIIAKRERSPSSRA